MTQEQYDALIKPIPQEQISKNTIQAAKAADEIVEHLFKLALVWIFIIGMIIFAIAYPHPISLTTVLILVLLNK